MVLASPRGLLFYADGAVCVMQMTHVPLVTHRGCGLAAATSVKAVHEVLRSVL